MRKIKTIGLIVTLIIFSFGCDKIKDPAGQRNIAVIPSISNVEPGIFDSKDLVNSFVQFDVTLGSGMQADKAIVDGSYNGSLERVQIAEVTSFPATIKIISGDVLQKLGIDAANVKNGDVFTLEVLVNANGVTTRSNAVLNVNVACAFDKALTAGSYHSVSADWGSEGNITLTADPGDPYTINVAGLETIEGVNEDKGPLVMHINPATFAVTADKAILASSAFGYTNLAYAGSGVYNSCDGSYVMSFDISVDEGAFGRFAFTFTKNSK
jgi:hypothetical protein